MEKAIEKAEALAENLKAYVNTRIDAVKLEVAEKLSALLGNIVAGLIVGVIFLCFIAFAGVGLSIVLGEWIGEMWAGFLIVAILYFLKAVIIWKARNRIIRIPIMNSLIKQLFKDDTQD
ncbi:MAG: phage holin family protein [Bacteroidota bacterium]